MIKVFYSPPGLNVSETLFRYALKDYSLNSYHDYSGILSVVPSSLMARESQKIFHRLVAGESHGICYIPPDVVTLDQLARKVYALFGDKRVLDDSLVPVILSLISRRGLGFSSLVAHFIRDIDNRYPDQGIDEIRGIFDEIFRDLGIPEPAANICIESLDLYDRFKTFLDEKGVARREDLLRFGRDRFPLVSGKIVIINGFYDPVNSERDALRALIERAELSLIALPFDPEHSGLSEGYISFLKEIAPLEEIPMGIAPKGESRLSLRDAGSRERPDGDRFVYHPYSDPEEEVEGIAKKIKSLALSERFGRLEEIVVAFPDLPRYAPLVERVFRRYGIPFVLSLRKPLGMRRRFLDLICLLVSVAGNYPRLKFAQFLASDAFTKIPEALRRCVPLFSLQSGIVSGKESWLSLIAEGSEAIDMERLPKDEIEKGLLWVFDKLEILEEHRSGSTFHLYGDMLGNLLDEFGFIAVLPYVPAGGNESGGPLPEEKKAFQEVMERLSLLGELYPGSVSLTEFTQVLAHLLNASPVEEKGYGVRVMDFFEAPGLSPGFLYLGGLTDRAMPRRQETDYFLPDSAKKRAGFTHLDKYLELQRFIFSRLATSSMNIHLSYPQTDGEDTLLHSSFLYSGEEMKEDIPGIFSKEEQLTRTGSRPLASRITEVRDASHGSRFRAYLKVTDVDAYRFCPRKFFIERVAEMSPLSVKEYEVEAITLGNILHRIMEKIIPQPMKDLENLGTRAAEIAEGVIGEKKIGDYWKALIRDTFLEILPDIIEREREIRAEGYVSSSVERSISGEPLDGIMLKGKIDRFDRIGDSVQIIDYKTGAAGLNCSQVVRGNENLQLFLYAAILKSQGYRVERVGVYSLKDVRIKWCPSVRACRGGDRGTIDDYIVASLGFLEEAARGLRAGDFTARPLQEYNCRNCHEYSLCPYIQQ